jgi:hypothetical protein
VIFRRRRVRIEIEENRLTLGFVQPLAPAPAATEPQTTAALLLSPSASEPNPPLVAKGKSTPEGTRHVR